MINPKDHPNASMALIAGYVASVLVYTAKRLGVELTPEEATTAAAGLIGAVLFLAKRGPSK